MKLLAGLMLAIQAEQDECGPANHKVNRVILLFFEILPQRVRCRYQSFT